MNKLITAKVAKLSTKMLKEMAVSLFNDDREEAGLVLSAVLDTLMTRLPEDEFTAFCEEVA